MVVCSKCGGETEYKKAVSKKGNPYEGYKCLDERCNNFDFITPKPKPKGDGTIIILGEIATEIKKLNTGITELITYLKSRIL